MSGLSTIGAGVVRLRITLSGQDVALAARAYQLQTRFQRQRHLYLYERPRHHHEPRLIDGGITAIASQEPHAAFRSEVTITLSSQQRLDSLRSTYRNAPGHRLRIERDWTVHQHRTLARLVYDARQPAPTTHDPQTGSPRSGSDTTAWLFSDHQRRFAQCGHLNGPSGLEPLHPYGPILTETWQLHEHGIEMRVQRLNPSTAPPANQLLDITTLTTPEDAPLIFPIMAASVRRQGIDPATFTGSRTRRLLDQLQ